MDRMLLTVLQQTPAKSLNSPHLTSLRWNRHNHLFLTQCPSCSTQQIIQGGREEKRGEGRADGIILMQIINNQINPCIMTRVSLGTELRKNTAVFPGSKSERNVIKSAPKLAFFTFFHFSSIFFPHLFYTGGRAMWQSKDRKLQCLKSTSVFKRFLSASHEQGDQMLTL